MTDISFFITKRYLKAKYKQIFLSTISFLSILGVVLGVAALIVTLSIMNGFHKDIVSKILSSNPHITIINKFQEEIDNPQDVIKKIDSLPFVKASSPFVYGQGILSKSNITKSVIIKAVDIKNEDKVTGFSKYIINQPSNSLENLEDSEIIVGSELAKDLNLSLGDDVVFISPKFSLGILGQIPKWFKLKVVGIIKIGMHEYDSHIIYSNIETGKKIFSLKSVSAIGVRVDDVQKSDDLAIFIQKILPSDLVTRSWLDSNHSLLSAIKLEKIVMFIILIMIIIVAGFGIISSLILTTIEKTKDIGILKSLGMPRSKIMKIFLYQGIVVGVIGTIVGTIVGLVLCFLLSKYKFINLPQDVYYISTLPVDIETFDVLTIIFLSIIITLLASFFPAYKASRLDPSTTIRYE